MVHRIEILSRNPAIEKDDSEDDHDVYLVSITDGQEAIGRGVSV